MQDMFTAISFQNAASTHFLARRCSIFLSKSPHKFKPNGSKLNFRGILQKLFTVGVTALTYSDELNQGVVDEGSLRKEEAAPGTQVVKEEQVLILKKTIEFC